MQRVREQDEPELLNGENEELPSYETAPLLLDSSSAPLEGTSGTTANADLDAIPAVDLLDSVTLSDVFPSSYIQNKPSKETFLDQCRYAFLETFLFDGFDVRKKKVATSQGIQSFCHAKDCTRYTLSWGLILTSLLGLPNRLEKVEKSINGRVRFTLSLSGLQFLRGLIGGWDPLHEEGKLVLTPKKVLQILAIPIKGLIILPLKLFVVFPFKAIVNIAKLFTEFLPSLGVFIFAPLLSSAFQGLRDSFKNEQRGFGKNILFFVGYLIWTLVVLVPFLLCRALKFFGMTITSPDKSARISYTSAKKSVKNNLEKLDWVKSRPWLQLIIKGFSYFLGVLSAMLSILTTAGLWAITFPLIFGAIATYIPIVQQAIVWVSQFPVIATFLTSLESSLAVVGIGTAHAYGAFIKFISGIFSIEVSTFILLVGTAFGALAAPICSGLSRISDALSDWWATWNKQPFFEHLKTLFINTETNKRAGLKTSSPGIELIEMRKSADADSQKYILLSEQSESEALNAVAQADAHHTRVIGQGAEHQGISLASTNDSSVVIPGKSTALGKWGDL